MPHLNLVLLLVSAIACASCSSAPAKNPTPQSFPDWDGTPSSEENSRYRATTGTKGMVVSDDEQASQWGVEILKRGGNAVDAAVATAFMLSVTRPHYASLGGGGFLVFCPAPRGGVKQKCSTIDYREQAPAAATRDMYIRNGKADPHLSEAGSLAPGVPGVVDGLLLALDRFGTRKRGEILSKPIEIAKKGTRLSSYTETILWYRWDVANTEAKRVFGCDSSVSKDRKPCAVGTLLKQPDLAKVLGEISEKGRAGFYSGWVAKALVEGLKKEGGIISELDLANYRARLREPIVGSYLGNEVVSMPPPSSGGTILVQLLQFAEKARAQGLFSRGFGSASSIHALSHAMALGFADRAEYFADPDFHSVPVDILTSPAYLERRWSTFSPTQANLEIIKGNLAPAGEGSHTTHFSVVDRFGNAVSLTTTLNDSFGAAFVSPRTGVVLNSEMDDFAAEPGKPNFFGLIQGEKNAVFPGKRPLSSMTPTIVRDGSGQTRVVIGALGGPRIITSVFLALVNRFEFGMSLADAVIAPRFHHQWRPNLIRLEDHGFSAETRDELIRLGYALESIGVTGELSALERFPSGRVWGIADPRTEGRAVAE